MTYLPFKHYDGRIIWVHTFSILIDGKFLGINYYIGEDRWRTSGSEYCEQYIKPADLRPIDYTGVFNSL